MSNDKRPSLSIAGWDDEPEALGPHEPHRAATAPTDQWGELPVGVTPGDVALTVDDAARQLAALLPDRETLIAAFEAARVVGAWHRGMTEDDLVAPTRSEAERMADVALAAQGGPEGTAPAGDEADMRAYYCRLNTGGEHEAGRGRDQGECVWCDTPLPAPSRSGRPDPGEDESDLRRVNWRSAELLEKFRYDLAVALHADEATGFPDLVNLVHLTVKRYEDAGPAAPAAPSSATTEGADTGEKPIGRERLECDRCGAIRYRGQLYQLGDPCPLACCGKFRFPGSGTVPASEGDDQ